MSTKITLSFALLILFTTFLKAQLVPIDLEAQLAEAFVPLDLTPVENSTNIFMDKMPQYITLANHRGKYIADSTRLVLVNYLTGT